ncbi:hypothetical protein AXF42_Ash002330 [Apostasia shenzhenica]|uniref:Uncharacterized protein n=1 Tax=Apostasia shenzhenica TaxID=1088818 RepID=A0A2I0ANJ0_9ASPA|nr:hypothetical protein AXF42_Ash002330 [Apostasia shenzhenica]
MLKVIYFDHHAYYLERRFLHAIYKLKSLVRRRMLKKISDQDSVHSTAGHSSSVDLIDRNCRALVSLPPPSNAEALAMVPLH